MVKLQNFLVGASIPWYLGNCQWCRSLVFPNFLNVPTSSIFVAIATFSIGTSGSTISSPLSWLPSNAKVHVDDEDILDGNFFLSFSKYVWRKWISKKILGVFSSSKSQWLCKKKENHLFYCLPLSLLNIKITSKPPLFFLASKCMVAWTSDINFRNLVTDAIWQSDLVTVPSLQITWNWRRELPISTFGLAMNSFTRNTCSFWCLGMTRIFYPERGIQGPDAAVCFADF